MLPKMRYRLGLDLGTTSIGWCLIRLDKKDNPIAVIRMGVRIFSNGRNPKDGSSLAVTRRNARQMRRRRDRLLKRKQRLIDALVRLAFFPEHAIERHALTKLDPYRLRKKGLYEALSGPEFARALFHINQRRGFLSNRKTDKKDNESGALKTAIRLLRDRLQEENCQTLGEWLANRHERGESVRARLHGKTQKDKSYDFYADRSMIKHEFETLWLKQASFNPDLFTQVAHDELKRILLFQRPLLPVKPGRCTLMPDEERAPQALPSAQRFRIYQELNNLRFLSADLTERDLTLEERDTLAGLLGKGDATFTKIRKTLDISGKTHFNLEDVKRDRLKGNKTAAILAKKDHFSDAWHEYSLEAQDGIVDKLLNEPSESELIAWLQKNTGIDEATAEIIANVNLPEGHGNLSRTALNRVLPELVKGVIVYSEAVTRAGFDSHSALSHTQQTGEIMEALPYYGEPLQRHVAFGTGNPNDPIEKRFGKIANPTVHIGLNELRKVVNALIKRYGHPGEVVIEVTRDLKLSRQRKLEIQRDQATKQKLNEKHVQDACKVLGLSPDNLDKNKRRELSQKMQLWRELNMNDVAGRFCPYSGEVIGIEKLLSNQVEIEHILPFSMTLDDSLNNKTVAISRANRIKGNQTPHEAFGDNKEPDYDYVAILQRAALMPRAKGKRFAPDGYKQWLRDDKDFLARSLNDTAYLSRVAKEYLSLVCPDRVRAIPGRMTAMLRGKFGLNSMLSGSNIKNRDDHRHHALDAAVIGITDQDLLQRFAKASASARVHQLNRLVDGMPLPWPTYREHVGRAVSNIIVSHRPDHGYQGAMHEETAWGIRSDGLAARHIQPEDGGLRRLEVKKKNLVKINSSNNPTRHGVNEDGEPKPYKGYVGGSNYCIEIWCDDKGKWKGDVISTFQAYQIIRRLDEAAGYGQLRNPTETQAGVPLVMRLMINDLVKMDIGNSTSLMRVVKIGKNGQIFFAGHNEANTDARNRDKGDGYTFVSKLPGSFKAAHGRHVTVSAIGNINDPGFRD